MAFKSFTILIIKALLMGLVPNVAPLIRETIPALVQRFRDDAVDAVLLVPS